MGAKQMTESVVLVHVVTSKRMKHVDLLPNRYSLPDGAAEWGYFRYKGAAFRVAEGTKASVNSLFGVSDILDSDVIAYGIALWELSK